MSSKSSTDRTAQVVDLVVRSYVTTLHQRYAEAAERVGGPVYPELARLSAKITEAVSGQNPVRELRALAWQAPSSGVGEVAATVAQLLEGAGR